MTRLRFCSLRKCVSTAPVDPLIRDTRGATMTEYLVIVGVVALAAGAAFVKFDGAVAAALRKEPEQTAKLDGDDSQRGGPTAAEIAEAVAYVHVNNVAGGQHDREIADHLSGHGKDEHGGPPPADSHATRGASTPGTPGTPGAPGTPGTPGTLATLPATTTPNTAQTPRTSQTPPIARTSPTTPAAQTSPDSRLSQTSQASTRTADNSPTVPRDTSKVPAKDSPFCTGPGCGAGTSCFVSGTPVATTSGARAIEDVHAGDVVLSRDDTTGETLERPVTRVFVRLGSSLVDVEVTTPRGEADVIRSTPEHPYWTLDRGWATAGSLSVGERLLDARGSELSVSRVDAIAAQALVYNLEVEGTHTYFAGRAAAWVHNTCAGLPWQPGVGALPAGPIRDTFAGGKVIDVPASDKLANPKLTKFGNPNGLTFVHVDTKQAMNSGGRSPIAAVSPLDSKKPGVVAAQFVSVPHGGTVAGKVDADATLVLTDNLTGCTVAVKPGAPDVLIHINVPPSDREPAERARAYVDRQLSRQGIDPANPGNAVIVRPEDYGWTGDAPTAGFVYGQRDAASGDMKYYLVEHSLSNQITRSKDITPDRAASSTAPDTARVVAESWLSAVKEVTPENLADAAATWRANLTQLGAAPSSSRGALDEHTEAYAQALRDVARVALTGAPSTPPSPEQTAATNARIESWVQGAADPQLEDAIAKLSGPAAAQVIAKIELDTVWHPDATRDAPTAGNGPCGARPCYTDFSTAFQPNDVVYGNGTIPRFEAGRPEGPRTDALRELDSARGIADKLGIAPEVVPPNRRFITHDALNSAAWPALNTDKARLDDYYADQEIDELSWGNADDASRAKAYRDYVKDHPKYDVANEANRSAQSTNPNVPGATLGRQVYWHHTSKAGLAFQLTQTAGSVHFIIGDGATLDTFVENATDKKSKFGLSVTSSEIRWLYRHRNEPGTQDRVRFWGPSGEIPQAAIFDDPRWRTYEMNRRHAKH